MNSKEALETLGNVEVAVTTIKSGITHFKTLKEQYETEFEILEKELLFIRDIKPFNVHQKQVEQLEKENTKLKQALEKACERLDYTCPVEEELIEDLNCEECNSNSEECWAKFFLKEALKNE